MWAGSDTLCDLVLGVRKRSRPAQAAEDPRAANPAPPDPPATPSPRPATPRPTSTPPAPPTTSIYRPLSTRNPLISRTFSPPRRTEQPPQHPYFFRSKWSNGSPGSDLRRRGFFAYRLLHRSRRGSAARVGAAGPWTGPIGARGRHRSEVEAAARTRLRDRRTSPIVLAGSTRRASVGRSRYDRSITVNDTYLTRRPSRGPILQPIPARKSDLSEPWSSLESSWGRVGDATRLLGVNP